jgi:hypothetical protein
MRLKRSSQMLIPLVALFLLVSCDNGGQVTGLKDLSPTQLVAKARTLKMVSAIRNYWPSPDGSKLLVMDDGLHMSMVDLAKGDAVSAVNPGLPPGTQAAQVEWSPDSSAFAYSLSSADGKQPGSIIVIRDASGGTSVEVKQSGIDRLTSPAWNSKGTALYFLANEGGKQQLMNVGRDGKTITAMFATTSKPSEQADFVQPTPDSTHFIYNIRDTATTAPQGGIYVSQADGSNRQQLSNEASVSALHMSPQGDRVLIEQNRGTYIITATFSSILWFSPLRAGDRKLLLPFPQAMTNTPPEVLSGATTLGAAWSPAGDKIVYITHNYAATSEPPRSLWVVAADGSDPAEVYTSTQETDLSLPDGQTLVWAGNDSVVTSNLGDTFTIVQLDRKQ